MREIKGQLDEGESLHGFLERKLPPETVQRASDVANALREAGARYDRYATRKKEWLNYRTRRQRLKKISDFAKGLASELGDLDILSRDDLATRLGSIEIETIIGTLAVLNKKSTNLLPEVQPDGRPRDLAEERWITELADIYENAFRRPARVWGSGAGPTKHRGGFYRLLQLSLPSSFFRHGKLSVRQVDRTLKKRDFEMRLRKGRLTLEEVGQHYQKLIAKKK